MINRGPGGEITSITPSWEMGMELREILFHHLGEVNDALLDDLTVYVKTVFSMGKEGGPTNGGTE